MGGIILIIFLIVGAAARLSISKRVLNRAKNDTNNKLYVETVMIAEVIYNERKTTKNVILMTAFIYIVIDIIYLIYCFYNH